MGKHLYNTTLGKVPWFVKRFGVSEIALKPLRLLFAPLIIPLLPRKTFIFQGRTLDCFYHRYNMTWATERAVEVPIGQFYLQEFNGKRILEVGNVLGHYFAPQHEVLDKFEKAEGVINEDILSYTPPHKFDLILSISTFEHIGFDDEADQPSSRKILKAIAACRRMLQTGGKLVLTVPIGYNRDLDGLIRTGELGASREFYLSRTGRTDWALGEKSEALNRKFRSPYPYANAILVAEFGCATGSDGLTAAAEAEPQAHAGRANA